jgi:hypothetical protein
MSLRRRLRRDVAEHLTTYLLSLDSPPTSPFASEPNYTLHHVNLTRSHLLWISRLVALAASPLGPGLCLRVARCISVNNGREAVGPLALLFMQLLVWPPSP